MGLGEAIVRDTKRRARERQQRGKGLRVPRVNKLSSHYRRLATRYTLVKSRKQMSVTTKEMRDRLDGTRGRTPASPYTRLPGFIRMAGY